MKKKSEAIGFGYKAFRSIASRLYYLRLDLEYHESFSAKVSNIKGCGKVSDNFFRQYKKKWLPWSSSWFLSRKEVELYCHMGGKPSIDYLPVNVFFSSVDPVLNDKQMAWGYAEKGNYLKLFDVDNEPLSILRELNGLWIDFKGQIIKNPEEFFENHLKDQSKIIVKPVIDSWGGRNILAFEKNKSGRWNCLNGDVSLTLNNLKSYYTRNFVIQEFVKQHPFYQRFNSSSFNTLRIHVYRSPADEEPKILHTKLKVGRAGSVVDNTKAGASNFYVCQDGSFTYGFTKKMEKLEFLPGEPQTSILDIGKAPGIDAIYDMVKKVALKIPYSRLIAFDANIDAKGKPRLIELNTSGAGIGSQLFGYPFFGEFTQEVIEYCQKYKKVDFLRF